MYKADSVGYRQRRKRLKNLLKKLVSFRDRRDWAQFHDPKDLAEAISIEAAELLELFLWKTPDESRQLPDSVRAHAAEEVADVFIYLALLSHELGVDIEKAVLDKLEKNEKRYPEVKAKGNATKYTELS
jgi:dCTP diphosphatase